MTQIAADLQELFHLNRMLSYILAMVGLIFFYLIVIFLCYLLWKFIQKINHKIFLKIENKKGRSMSLEFLEKLTSFAITFFFLIAPFNWDDIGDSIFGSAAVLTAVIGFAAQDVIRDILAGIQISIYKPFDIGDRIEGGDGTSGVVENITMRHVVLKRIDTVRLVVPNSKLNNMSVLNYSYDNIPRSVTLKYPVSYTSDIEKTKQVIGQVIQDSSLTIPGM
ncbi:MAG: mechanosensitive ion channel family protein [Anaerolineaceae bacterium]|nr:mechanosensitive ion channel family protein [Anaerolineaceae bacterium]